MKMRHRRVRRVRYLRIVVTCIEVHSMPGITWTVHPGVYDRPYGYRPFPVIERFPQS